MCQLDAVYPEYGFAAHKGYATRDHLEQLARYGPCIQHRRSWAAVQRRGAMAEVPPPAYLLSTPSDAQGVAESVPASNIDASR